VKILEFQRNGKGRKTRPLKNPKNLDLQSESPPLFALASDEEIPLKLVQYKPMEGRKLSFKNPFLKLLYEKLTSATKILSLEKYRLEGSSLLKLKFLFVN
jgi:hypothetical protein